MNISIQAFVLLVATTSTTAQSELPALISRSDYALCETTIGDTEGRVREILGPPESSTTESSPTFCDVESDARWPGITASFCDEELVNLTVTSTQCTTPSGVKVGMSQTEVLSILGSAEPEALEGDEVRFRYWVENTEQYLLVFSSKGRVQKVMLWYDYT
jgi:predicted secreted protein